MKYDDLSPEARDHAFNYWRNQPLCDDWFDSVYDGFREDLALLGIEVDEMYFTGFWSQGDGASFSGRYTYRKGKVDLPADLAKIATRLRNLQRPRFYRVDGNITIAPSHYCHEMTMRFDYEDEDFLECFRDCARALYSRLESKYTYLTSREAFEKIAADMDFDEDGDYL